MQLKTKKYNLIRNGGNLSTVNNNVEYFLFQNKSVNVILQFIDMFINREEHELFKEKWSKHNQNISIQCLYTWANQLPFMNFASDNSFIDDWDEKHYQKLITF